MARILVIEDEPGIAFGLESDLLTEGYDVAVVGDGIEAVRRALAETFDLILLDVMLPGKDGFEVCRELRQTGLSTPIVMLTARTREFDKVMGLDGGADDYVSKPFSPRELRARIRTALRHQPGGPSLAADVQRQLHTAAEVQQRLFPQVRPVSATLDYTAFSQPALGMSGDYYDFLDLGGEKIGLLVADVAGKGIPAAMVMASVHGSIRMHAPLLGDHCGEVLARLNASLYESTNSGTFATMFYAVYDGRSRTLAYANAGHEPPVLFRRPTHSCLSSKTTPVGILPTIPVLQEAIQLIPGDWLVIFTDGVTEARNEDGEDFGSERVQAVVARQAEGTAQEMSDAILAELREHSRGVQQLDDITLITARVL
jgi:serine phosphatase RsbU (regulator of sigma subunit)